MSDGKIKILFADDDVKYSILLKTFLEAAGYEVVHVPDGLQAMQQFEILKPDLVLLDVNMTGLDGFEVTRRIRQTNRNVIIFFLSDRTEKTDRLKGFQLKGNDYIPKPFYPEELIARIKERFAQRRQTDYIRFGNTVFYPERNTVVVADDKSVISSRQAAILQILTEHLGETVERGVLLNLVWGDDSYANSLALNVQITYLRRVLRKDPLVRIASVKRKGYVLCTAEERLAE